LLSRVEGVAKTTIPLVLAHNQIVPSNVLIDDSGKVKVLDRNFVQFNYYPPHDPFVWISSALRKK